MSVSDVSAGSSSEFRRGWRVVVGSFLGMALGVASLYFYSIGIFIKPLAAEFGWGRGAASAASMLGTVFAALVAMPVGRLADRIGAVRVALGSLLLLAVSFAALGAFTNGLVTWRLTPATLAVIR